MKEKKEFCPKAKFIGYSSSDQPLYECEELDSIVKAKEKQWGYELKGIRLRITPAATICKEWCKFRGKT